MRAKKKRDDANNRQMPMLTSRIAYSLNSLKDWLNPSSYQMSPQVLEQKYKEAKTKIAIRKWNAREIRRQKFGGTSDGGSFYKLLNCIIFIIFISLFSSMLENQQQMLESAELAALTRSTLIESLSFVPLHKYQN